jgi:hypothetical protein
MNVLTPLIREHDYLFWWIPKHQRENLSPEAVVEAVLNYGGEKTVGQLLDILGVDQVADIFYRQTARHRSNYKPRTIHFFQLYFQKHAKRRLDIESD